MIRLLGLACTFAALLLGTACGEREYVVVVESASVDEGWFDDFDCSDAGGIDFKVVVTRNSTGEDSETDTQDTCTPFWGTAVFGGDPIPRSELLDYGLRLDLGEEFAFGTEFSIWETHSMVLDKDDIQAESVSLTGDCTTVNVSFHRWKGE